MRRKKRLAHASHGSTLEGLDLLVYILFSVFYTGADTKVQHFGEVHIHRTFVLTSFFIVAQCRSISYSDSVQGQGKKLHNIIRTNSTGVIIFFPADILQIFQDILYGIFRREWSHSDGVHE